MRCAGMIAPDAIEKPRYIDLDYNTKPKSTTNIDMTKTFGTQTDTSSQQFYVRDEWTVV